VRQRRGRVPTRARPGRGIENQRISAP